jgi:hypothetical protein
MIRGLKSWQLGIAIALNQLLKSQRKPARPAGTLWLLPSLGRPLVRVPAVGCDVPENCF